MLERDKFVNTTHKKLNKSLSPTCAIDDNYELINNDEEALGSKNNNDINSYLNDSVVNCTSLNNFERRGNDNISFISQLQG